MFSEKLLSLLATLSKYELNRFRKFLLSPYFNEQEELLQMFEHCNTALRKGPAAVAALDKHSVWQQLYPDRTLDEAQLRRQASELTQLGLKFLALETREHDPLQEWLELQKALERPGLQKHLAGVERHLQSHLQQQGFQSTAYYLAGFQLHWNIFNRASKVVANTDFMQKLLPADHFLDSLYVVQKLKFYVSWLIYRGFRSTEEELPVMPGFWEYLKTPRFERVPLIRIYEAVVLSLMQPDNEEHFHHLMKNLEQYAQDLTKEDLRECYYIAQNYCAFKINQGKTEYYQVVFDIYKSIIKLGVLLENDQLSEGAFKNIVTTGLRVGEFDWAENFIMEHSKHLPASVRENARSFNLASLYLQRKQNNKAIELLSGVEYNDVVYALGSKLLLTIAYYEQKELIVLDSLIDSFRIYLRRNKVISKDLKREYNNFLNFVKKLMTIDSANFQSRAILKKKLLETKSVTSKKWLLEKIAEIEARHEKRSGR